MKANVVSRLSSMRGPQMSKIYCGARWAISGFPELKEIADKNSSFFSGRFAKAIQPKIHLMRSTDRGSKWMSI